MTSIHYIQDLTKLLTELPSDSILSRTVYKDEKIKVILFSFAAGQELSQHTAAVAAILHFLEGEAEVQLGEQDYRPQPGSWVYLPPNTPHSILAKTPLTMLLTLLGN